MKIVIAMDSFKGSLSSVAAGNAAAGGIRKAIPQADIRIYPVADGGEGTTEALVTGLSGTYHEITVSDPLGRPIPAKYGILPDQTAVIEMSAASGLTLLTPAERNPMHTTSFGFGQMIADAIYHGCRNFLLGIGGSATNDCGIGCLQALGFSFLDTNGQQVPYGADGLAQVVTINTAHVMPELRECTFHVVCDVNNPLCGAQGCSAVFARQKGADDAMIDAMERAIRRLAGTVQKQFPNADPELPGSGAAGGLGFALRTFLHADLQPGIEVVTQQIRLEDAIREVDIVVTGEGRMDAQTAMGKAPVGIAKIAKRYGVPVIAFCGCVGEGAELCNQQGIDAYFPVLRTITDIDTAMQPENAAHDLSETAEQVFRLLSTCCHNTLSGGTQCEDACGIYKTSKNSMAGRRSLDRRILIHSD